MATMRGVMKWFPKSQIAKRPIGIKRKYQGTKAPHLVSLDFSKRKGCNHPDIKENTYYLVQYDGRFYAGQFGKQWYGWNLDAVYDAGTQLDDSCIQFIWEIVPQTKLEKKVIIEHCETFFDNVRAKKCPGILKYLETCSGDPEGIRRDRWCPECGVIWGCTKAHFHKIGMAKKVNGKFVVDSDLEVW